MSEEEEFELDFKEFFDSLALDKENSTENSVDEASNMEKLSMEELPVIALRGLVVFPEMILHFDVGRQKSARAIEVAMKSDRRIFVVAQKDFAVDNPSYNDLYEVGVIAEVKQIIKDDPDIIRVVVEGKKRAKLCVEIQSSPYISALVTDFEDVYDDKDEEKALLKVLKDVFKVYLTKAKKFPQKVAVDALASRNSAKVCDLICANMRFSYDEKQELIEEKKVNNRLELLTTRLSEEMYVLELEDSLEKMVSEKIRGEQREYYIREEIKTLKAELGEDEEDEAEDLLEKVRNLHLAEDVEKVLVKECGKLANMPAFSQEANVLRTYLETCIELPWNNFDEEIINISKAKKMLDKNHYGLTKVKDRIIEALAIRKLSPETKGQILCFVGPPGVGKTSIAQSIAKALNRKCQRIALGGVHDESEIRGHRRTYVGAMPGRIMNAIRLAETSNPVIILDEIDKLSGDYKGDPTSALLEVLDSEQNNKFVDHYIDLPYDLSKVFFIATANDYSSIPEPLMDRMDIINVDSYTREEKFNIATKHIVPKVMKNSGIKSSQLRINKNVIYDLIDSYTKEAGVRSLERRISDLTRKVAVNIVEDENYKASITTKNIEDFLGPRKYKPEKVEKDNLVGVVNGLAWTSVGGTTLPIEVALLDGTGKIELTGSLGDVMKESAKIAISCARTMADKLKIDKDFYKKYDIHIHAPEGAVPKDGPSAGITMTTAIVSALTNIPVRSDVAMTGEITLRGRVLPIGGLKEKTMAAYRVGMKTVIIPEDNKVDLYEVDPVVKEAVEFVPVSSIEQVLEVALVKDNSVKNNCEAEKKPKRKSKKSIEPTEQPMCSV